MFRFAVQSHSAQQRWSSTETPWSFQSLLEGWWNGVLSSQTVLCVINASIIEYAISTYSWPDNNRQQVGESTFGEGNKWSVTCSSSLNRKLPVGCIGAIHGKVAARSKFGPLGMKQLQFHLSPIKNIFIFYNTGSVQIVAEIIQDDSTGLKTSINLGWMTCWSLM